MILKSLIVGPMEVNCYILACERTNEGIVIDPGDDPQEVLRAVAEDGISVREIVATHGHFDHIGRAREVQQVLKVPLAIHRDDLFLVEGLEDAAALFGVKVGPPPEVIRFLSEGDEVRFGDESLRVLHTPGHSPGGITLVRDGVALVGDCLFAGGIGRTDLPGQSHDLLMASIRDKLLTLDDATEVYPGHGPATTIGEERRYNPFLHGGSKMDFFSKKKDVYAHQIIGNLPAFPTKELLKTSWETVESLQGLEGKQERIKAELFLLTIFANDCAICNAFSDDPATTNALLDSFYSYFQEFSKQSGAEYMGDIENRRRVYAKAASNPHPEYGISFSVGKAFSELCGTTDVALILLASKLFQIIVINTKKYLEDVRKEYRILPDVV